MVNKDWFYLSLKDPRADSVIYKLIHDQNNTVDSESFALKHLDKSGLRGSQISIAYEDYCKGDVLLFRKLLFTRDIDMINHAMKESF